MNRFVRSFVFAWVFLGCAAAGAEAGFSRLKTFCSVGKELTVLNGYQEVALLRHEGKDCLTYMWSGGDWKDISYLEAMMRAHLDGAKAPTLLSSGPGDYFLGTYYFDRGGYANALAGLTHLDTKENAFSADRFHDDQPLFFRKGLCLTCRCGEESNGKKLHDPAETRFTTYTWTYEW